MFTRFSTRRTLETSFNSFKVRDDINVPGIKTATNSQRLLISLPQLEEYNKLINIPCAWYSFLLFFEALELSNKIDLFQCGGGFVDSGAQVKVSCLDE